MRRCVASASFSPASAAWSPASAALTAASAAAAPASARARLASRSRLSSTMSGWPVRTRSPGRARTSRTSATMRATMVAVVRARTVPPASNGRCSWAAATCVTATSIGVASATAVGGSWLQAMTSPASAVIPAVRTSVDIMV